MNKKILCLFTIFFVGAVAIAEAQQPGKVYRVGRLTGGSPVDPLSKESFEAFRQGLHNLGWIEGQNIVFEPRWTGEKPESLRELAVDLVRLRVDVIVANGAPMVQAVKRQRPLSLSSWRQLELIRWRRASSLASLILARTLLD